MTNRRHASAWEDWGQLDPLWSNLTEPGLEGRRWDLGEFWKVGEREIAGVMRTAERHGLPKRREEALDFGCGAGRLTRALTAYFERSTGVDGAESMVRLAAQLNDGLPCRFIHARDTDLARFPARTMDLVYSSFVLQHLPSKEAARRAIEGLAALVRPSGLFAFQLPTDVPSTSLRDRLALRTRAFSVLRALGVPPAVLFERMRLRPAMHMLAISTEDVLTGLRSCGFGVLEVKNESLPGGVQSATYFAAPTDVTRRSKAQPNG
jgi:SAM-dependent methyltransferase